MKKRSMILLLAVILIIPLLSSCKQETYINPKLKGAGGSGLAGTMGNKIVLGENESYSGYLGYGYNVVGKGYFNSGDVSPQSNIIDMDALAKDGKVYSVAKSDTESALYMGSTIKEYQTDISTKIGMTYSYGLFFTSVSADFSISSSSSTSIYSKSVYIKNLVNIQRERQYIDTSRMSIDDLKKYANSNIMELFNKDTSSMSDPEKQAYYVNLFNTYGTHVMMDIILGGRMDLNYVYDNTESKSVKEVEMDVNATYSTLRSDVTGSVSEDIKTRAENFIKKTTFNGERKGGTTAGSISSYDEAKASYKDWAQSIEDKHTLELIDVGDNCYTSLIGIWDLADSNRRQDIAAAYDRYLNDSGQMFADFDNNNNKPAPTALTYYVKDIYVGINDNSDMAVSDAESQISQRDPNSTYHILKYDLNNGVGGNYIYLVYTMTTNKDEAIKDIKVEWYNKDSNAPGTTNYANHSYTCIKRDLNSGAGGKFIYVYYTKDASAGEPLQELGVETDGKYSFGSSASGWVSVIGLTEDSKADCNKGSGGPYIFLWFRR